ncbi:hypothetical protein ACWDRR_37175 [Kitasatospora sp. NPDC003701]
MTPPPPHWLEIETPSTGTLHAGYTHHPAPAPRCCVGGALDLPKATERTSSAFHEAGHTVTALVLGIHVEAVNLGADLPNSVCGHPVSVGGANENMTDQLVLTKPDHALVVLAAGVRAQLMWLRKAGVELSADRAWAVEAGGLGDQTIADWLLRRQGHRLAYGTGPERYDYWEHEKVADAALDAVWERVERVAAALLERGRITGDEAATLIGLTNPLPAGR